MPLQKLNHQHRHIITIITVISSFLLLMSAVQYASAQSISAGDNSNTINSSSTSPSMKVSVRSAKNPINAGSVQVISVSVLDENGNAIKGASITATIIFPELDQPSQEFNGKTDENGNWSFSWQIDAGSKTGMYGVDVKASAAGIDDAFGSTFFQVTANR